MLSPRGGETLPEVSPEVRSEARPEASPREELRYACLGEAKPKVRQDPRRIWRRSRGGEDFPKARPEGEESQGGWARDIPKGSGVAGVLRQGLRPGPTPGET